MQKNILLVDDDTDALASLARALTLYIPQLHVHTAATESAALEIVMQKSPHAIVLDLCLDPKVGVTSGLAALEALRKLDPTVRILMLTGHTQSHNGIECMRAGAASFLTKPADIDHLAALLLDAIETTALKRESQRRKDRDVFAELHGASPSAIRLKEELLYAAHTDLPVLLTGETGTGKSLAAKLIHTATSARKDFSFVRYQPLYSAAEMVQSDLYGHRKGAFTGADTERKGLVHLAHRGTLFLDEVDELPIETQVSFLGFLQEKVFRALGSSDEQYSDFRLITACNKDISQSIASGKLREDFYHRIAHIEIEIPALRHRRSDISLLAESHLRALQDSEEVQVYTFHSSVMEQLEQYEWPGNIRELNASVASAAYKAQFAGRSEILLEDVRLKGNGNQKTNDEGLALHEKVKRFKLTEVQAALLQHENNQIQAAKALGIDRSTLRRILAG